MRYRIAITILVCLTSIQPASAVETGDLSSLFPSQAAVTAPASGLCRLDLPPNILASCRADLSDLRLFDASGRELPYLIESFAADEAGVEVIRSLRATVIDATRDQKRSRTAPTRFQETYLLEVPELPTGAGAWELVLETSRREVVRHIRLTSVAADGSRTVALEGSAFRLPSPVAERLRFALPPSSGRLELFLEGEGNGYLEPRLVLEARRFIAAAASRRIELERIRVEDHGDYSVAVFIRPSGLVPDHLTLTTSTGAFSRKVTVWDEGPTASPDPLGRDELFRINAFAPVESLEIEVAPARGERLRLVIADRDSPPLEDIRLEASVVRPFLFFSLPTGTTDATLRFGGARARRPDYDLAALRPSHSPAGLHGQEAERALALWDPAQFQQAVVGDVEDNPTYDPQPALAFAMHPGAEHSPGSYSHRRQLRVSPSSEGLARLVLNPDDLSVARSDLNDLRILDDQSRQWAYLVQQRAQRRQLELAISVETKDGKSRYRLVPDPSPVETSMLIIEPLATFFDRAYELEATTDSGERITLTQGRMVRHQGDPRPVTLAFSERRVTALELVVDDGDDAPLGFQSAALKVHAPAVFLAAPEGSYSLLLGHPEARAPRYELERIRSTVLAVPAGQVEAASLESNPAYNAASRLTSSAGAQRAALWVVLGIAVIALAWLTLRLARQEQ